MITLLLASTSPRRHELLRAAGISFVAVPPGDEPSGEGTPAERAMQRAVAKARGAELPVGVAGAVLGVDTVVEVDGTEFGKPEDRASAAAMLGRLQGRSHFVHTAHCLWLPAAARDWRSLATAAVRCRALDAAESEAYLDGGSWRDKAGGYGIQDMAAEFVTLEAGALDTVVGLHVPAVRELLEIARQEATP